MSNSILYNKELAKRVRELRKENNFTQEELAEKLSCSTQTIYNLENRKRPISKKMAKLMASSEVFNIPDVNYLLDENVKHKSKFDEFQSMWQRMKKNDALKLQIVSSLAELNGYNVEINEPKSDRMITIDEPITDEEIDVAITALKNYFLFKKDNKIEFSLSLPDAYNLGDNMAEMFMSSIKWYLNTKQEYGIQGRANNG